MTEPLPETVFREYQNGHERRHLDEDRAVVLRTEAVQREFLNHRQAHDEKHKSDQEAIRLQRETTDLRFKTITNEYVTREQFENFQSAEAAKRRTLAIGLAGLAVPIVALIIGSLN